MLLSFGPESAFVADVNDGIRLRQNTYNDILPGMKSANRLRVLVPDISVFP